MNKIFKVVWSKSKECYVVVSEVAKNNGGKKKVLASVLAGLAMVGAVGVGQVSAYSAGGGSDTGSNSVAIGPSAVASGSNGVAVGRANQATGTSSVALGVNNKAQAQDTTAVGSTNTIEAAATQASAFGRENTINLAGSLAAGYKNTTNGERNVAVGSENTTTGEDSIGIGTKVIAGTGKTIAIGSVASGYGKYLQTIARGNDTINAATGQVNNIFALAIGNGAQADGKAKSASGMIAIGQEVKADNNNTIAIGVKTEATGNNGTAVGGYAKAIGTSSAAFGPQAIANGIGATAFGPGASAGTGSGAADGSVAVGRKAAATAAGGVGIGWTASASEKNATAIGFSATASGVQSVAIGGGDEYDYPGTERGKHFTTASGKNSVAVGSYAKATEENAIAFGTDANANIAGGVALGSESKTTTVAGVQGYNPADSRTNKYSDQAGAVGTSTLAAVSVGNGLTATRQITGVAAGTADTDAVNVAQLKNVNLKYAGDTGNSDVLLKDGTLKVKGDTNFISTSADATGITVTAKIGDPITANTDGKAVAPTTNGLATTTNVADAINASGWKVTSLNNGGTTNGTTSEKVSPGDTVTFSAGKNIVLDQAGKQFTYSLSSTLKDIQSIQNGASKITLNNAGGTTISGGNLSVDGNKITKVAQGTDGTDAVNVDQLNAVAAKERHVKPGNYAVDGNGTVTLNYVDGNNADVADTAVISGIAKDDLSNITNAGKKVITGLSNKVVAGDNVTVTDTEDATTGQKTYKVSANLTKVTDGTNTTVTGAGTTADPYKVNVAGDLTGITSIANTAGGPTMTIGGNSINVTGGNLDLGSNKITNLAPGTISSTSTDAVNGSQLYDVDQKFNNTVKLTGNAGATDGQALNKANGLSFGVIGANNGKYISTSANGSDVTVDLSTDAKKLLNNTVEVKGKNAATVTTSTETTADGGTKTIYTVDVASTGTVAKSSWNIKSSADTANGGAEATGHEAAAKNIADTNTVEMVAGKNLTVKQTSDTDGAKVEYALNKDLKDLTSVTTEKVTTKEIGLQDPTGKVTTIKNDGDRITYTKDGDTKVHKVATLDDEKHIKPGSYAVQNDGSVTMTYVDGNGDPVANTEAKITGIAKQDLSNITDAGKNVITGLGTIVKAGDNVTVSEASDATTGQKTYTVNAVTPAVYTKADGTKVVKRPDGTFTTNVDGAPGNDVPASDVIVSIQDAAGNRTGGNSIVNNVGSAIDKTGTSTGDTFLTNLNNAATDNPFAAVNVRDLKSTADALKASELHIAPTSVATGSTEVVGGTASGNTNPGAATQAYKYNATTKQVELTFNDGNGKAVNGPKAVIDFSDLNTGGTAASSWNIKSSANTTDGGAIGDNHDAAAQNIADNKTVEFQAGKNLVVKQTNDAANGNATVEFSLSDNITAGKDGANGKDGSVGATGKDGSSVVLNGKDGSIGMTGPKGQDGKDGINGRDGANISITSAKGEQVLVNRDPAHNGDTDKAERIVYVPKDANGNPIQGADGKNIVREVATMDDGLRFTGNNTSTENKQKLGSLVKVEGEGVTEAQANSFQSATGNIAVVADGADKLTVKLNKDLKGLDSVTTKEVKLGDANDNISIKKAGDRITYTTPGSTDTHKVATLDDEMHIKDTTYTVDGNKKVTMTYVDGNGNPVAGKTAVIDLSGLPVGETDTDMRIKEGNYTATNGSVTLNTVDKAGNPVTGKDVVIKGINTNSYQAGDNVTFTNNGTDANGNPIVKINAEVSTEQVVAKAGNDNLATVAPATGSTQGGKNATYEVNVDKTNLENKAEISYKANGGTAQKTTLANGFNFTSDDNSVAITTGANGKVNFKVDTTGIQGKAFNLDVNKEGTGKVENAQTAAATPSVEKGTKFVAGNNLSIRHDGINGDANYDHQVTYALNSDLKGITSITNNGGATMNFGPNEVSITGGNLNMGGSKITNVKNGTDKSDVATVGQLTKVTSNDNTVAINKTTDADGAPVYDLSVQGGGHDPRVDQLGEEIGRVGAQGAALAALKPIQYDPLEPTQIMAGYGNYRGNSAIAMGVAHYKNESTMMHAGLAWAGGSRHMMANAGVTWKVGNRDSEAAVADRYRKGPISSAYAMQQEMASVKAQNAGLKTEVSDLKAENEQMKAQIAAMMAKLGM